MVRRRISWVLAGALALLIVPTGTASASQIFTAGDTLVYSASPGEVNHVDVTVSGTNPVTVHFSDPGASIAPVGCSPEGGPPVHGASCPIGPSISTVEVDGDDLDDRITFGSGFASRNLSAAAFGGDGSDTINGSDAGDDLEGDAGVDIINASSGDDTLVGGDGGDDLSGGAGSDTVSYDGVSDPVTVTLDGVPNDGAPGEGDNVGSNLGDIENEIGGDGADHLNGNSGANALSGGAGNDTLDGALGNDDLDGGNDTDTVSYGSHGGAVTAHVDSGGGQAGETDTFTAIENLTGGSGGDTLFGDSGDNVLDGAGGNDTLKADAEPAPPNPLTGSDTYIGGGGSDTVDYSARTSALTITEDGTANDGQTNESDDVKPDIETIIGGSAGDRLTGSAADNTLLGGGGNDTLDGGLGADVLDGQAGSDSATYGTRPAPVEITLDDAANDGQGGEGDNVKTENATGGNGNDTIVGNVNANSLNGGAGDDILDGGANADSLVGGAGEDTTTYASRTGGVVVSLDGSANDGDGTDGGTKDNVDTDDVVGSTGDDQLTGDPGNNVFRAGGGTDVLNGQGGDDTLDGGAGSDDLAGSAGNDTVSYASRTASVTASLDTTQNDGESGENDNIRGDVENLAGGAGNDTLTGNDGANTITGGDGQDTISSLGGPDTINSRDLFADNVSCGAAGDTVNADPRDTVGGDCETIDVAEPGAPPSGGNAGAGSNPGANQTTNNQTTTNTTQNKTPTKKTGRVLPRSLSAGVSPRRDRRAPYRFVVRGTVGVPKGTSRRAACSAGRVSVQVKAGSKTVSTRRASIDFNCRYRVTLSFKNRKRLGKGRLKITVRFLGNDTLRPRQARSFFVRAG